MLLIVEIVLTISAWRKGWGAKALFPGAGGLFAAFLTGAVMGNAGASAGATFGVLLLLDLSLVAVLSWMVRNAPRRASVPPTSPAAVIVSQSRTGEIGTEYAVARER
jgi:hypothetical protein